jgi:hypothetical protein
VVPIGCTVFALALVVAIVFWWVSHSHRLMTPQLGRAVSNRVVNDEETPPPKTNNKHARDNMPKSLTFKKIKHVTNNFKDELGKGAFGKVYLVQHTSHQPFRSLIDLQIKHICLKHIEFFIMPFLETKV